MSKPLVESAPKLTLVWGWSSAVLSPFVSQTLTVVLVVLVGEGVGEGFVPLVAVGVGVGLVLPGVGVQGGVFPVPQVGGAADALVSGAIKRAFKSSTRMRTREHEMRPLDRICFITRLLYS